MGLLAIAGGALRLISVFTLPLKEPKRHFVE
jgi:hypothetical protein